MLGFIGTGSMGGAILRGVLTTQHTAAAEILFTRANTDAAQKMSAELGVKHVTSNAELVRQLGKDALVILAVKPQQITKILAEIATTAAENGTVIVSVAAGVSLAKMLTSLSATQPVVRAMPNVASAIGQGMTAICPNRNVTAAQLEKVQQVFAAIGAVSTIAEKDFPAFTALAGCSPAWTFTYIDALSRAALAAGIPKIEAVKMAAQAVAGAAQLVLNQLPQQLPQALVDTVTSPGGTTVAGLIALERGGFSNCAIDAVQATIARDAELAGE